MLPTRGDTAGWSVVVNSPVSQHTEHTQTLTNVSHPTTLSIFGQSSGKLELSKAMKTDELDKLEIKLERGE